MADEPLESPARPRATGRRMRALLVTAVVAVAAFFTGLALFNFVLMPRWVHRGEEVRVPELTNLNVRQAEGVLDDAGLRLSVKGEQYDSQVPKGFILWQDPSPNEVVRRDRKVSVLVSLGEEFASVPVLLGESRRGARLLLSRAGLEVGEVIESYSSEVGRGLVVASEPGAQAVVPRGTAVHLLVSMGSPSNEFLMPDLRGREVKSVKQDLEALGFRVQVVGDMGALASIVDQVPAPGSRVLGGENVVLKVAGRVVQ